MDNMIGLDEVLALIDEKYGYMQDTLSIEILEKNDEQENKHLISRREMARIFHMYSKKRGCKDYYDVIKNNGKSTKGAKYAKDDIEKVLSDPDVIKKIERTLEKNAKKVPSGYVPICIYHEYVKEFIGEEEVEDEEILELTGYSMRQIELFSVPDDLLLIRKKDLDNKIALLKEELEKTQLEFEDVNNELMTRGY